MYKTMELQPPESFSLLRILANWWEWIVAFVTGLGLLIAFYKKYVKGKVKKARQWSKSFIETPRLIEEMRTQLTFANGETLQQWVDRRESSVVNLSRRIAFETHSRRIIYDTLSIPFFEADKNGMFMWANEALLTLAGADMQDILNNNWKNSIAIPDRASVIAGWNSAVKDGADLRIKFRLTTETSEVWVQMTAFCNKDELGQVLGFIGKLKEVPDPRIHGTE